MSEQRIKIILEWLEAHPRAYSDVRKKIGELAIANQQATTIALRNAKTTKQQEMVLKAAGEVYRETAINIYRRNIPAIDQGVQINAKMRKQQEELTKKAERFGAKIQRVGWRIGFFGWIVSFAARSIMRIFKQLFDAFKRLVKVSAEWPSSLGKVATALALLESRGLLTTDMEELLLDTMDRLIELGPDFEALWAGFEAAFIAVSTILTSKVVPAMATGLAKLAKFILENEDRIASIAERFIGEFIPALIDALPALMDFVESLLPLLPILTNILKTLGPVAPGLFLLGTALWFLGPILTALGAIFSGINTVFKTFAGQSLWAALASGTLLESLKAVGVGIGTLIVKAGPIISIILQIALLILNWADVLSGNLSPNIKFLIDVLGGATMALTALGMVLKVISGPIGWIILAVEAIILAITHWKEIVDAISGALNWLGEQLGKIASALHPVNMAVRNFSDTLSPVVNVVKSIGDGIGSLVGALSSLCFRHVTPDVKKFSLNLEKARLKATEMSRTMRNLRGGLGTLEFHGTPGTVLPSGPTTQYITISAPISIGEVSAEFDLDDVKDATLRGLAEAIRRVRL